MSKILKPNNATLNKIRKQLLDDFKTLVQDLDNTPEKYLDRINFNKHYSLEIQATKQKLFIDSEAYLKMLQYVLKSTKEIAWHCTITHDKDNEYHIHDCMLYPQMVTGATVTTDQEKYQDWLTDLEDDIFNDLKCQGHSHVNMATSPSNVDLDYYEELVSTLPEDSYYVFLIMNKSQSLNVLIYNKKENMLYTKEDIEVIVLDHNKEFILDDIDIAIKEHISENNLFKRELNPKGLTSLQPPPPITAQDYYNDFDYYENFYNQLENSMHSKQNKKRGK